MPMHGKDLVIIITVSIFTVVMLVGYVMINVASSPNSDFIVGDHAKAAAAAKAGATTTDSHAAEDAHGEHKTDNAHDLPVPSVGPDAGHDAPPAQTDTTVRGH
jgi:hypothetical protein